MIDEKKQKNVVIRPDTLKFNMKLPGIKSIELISKSTAWIKKWVYFLITILILQIYFAFREPVLGYRIANLALIFLAIMAGYMAICKTIKIEKTIYQ